MQPDANYFEQRVYPLQDRVLAAFARVETGFYLSGGTAASRGYLHHLAAPEPERYLEELRKLGEALVTGG